MVIIVVAVASMRVKGMNQCRSIERHIPKLTLYRSKVPAVNNCRIISIFRGSRASGFKLTGMVDSGYVRKLRSQHHCRRKCAAGGLLSDELGRKAVCQGARASRRNRASGRGEQSAQG